jgi:hypothetical protein
MRGLAKIHRGIGLLGLVLFIGAGSAEAQVIRHPGQAGTLAERFEWARREAAGAKKMFYVGFSIRRLMGEHSMFGTNIEGAFGGGQTLEEMIYGRRPATEKNAAEVPGGAARERKIWKEVAILLKFASSAASDPSSVGAANLSMMVRLGDIPLYWLGPAEDGESLARLIAHFDKSPAGELRESLLHVIALHRKPDQVIPVLERVINGRDSESVRAEAAEYLGEQDDVRALPILKRLLGADPSLEVRKGAVAGLVELDLPEAADTLIEFALRGREKEIRNEAIQGLAEKATKKTIGTLEQLAYSDKDTEIQKEAVQALADLPEKDGLPYLIRVAKTHADPAVRIEAIEALGEFHDPAAVQALVEIIRKK